MLSLEVARPSELDQAALQAWADLQTARPDLQSPFLSPGWALAVEAAGPRVKVVLARQGGRLRGVFAASVGRTTAWPVGAPMCDVQAFVCEHGFACDPLELVRALGVTRYDFSHMTGEASPFDPFAQGRQASFIADLSGGYAAWERQRAMGSSHFKTLRRKRRKLESTLGPLRFTALSAERADLERLIAWKRRRYAATGQTDLFAGGWPPALIERLYGPERDGVRAGLFTLHAGDVLAAAHLHLISPSVVHAWMIGYEQEAGAASPSLLLFEDILRWMDGRWRELDFGPVDYGFKSHFANAERPVGHGFAGAPSPATLVRAAEYGVRRAVERLPLGRVSAWPGKAMRRLDLWRALNATGA